MKPTKHQAEFFERCFGCCRFVYNHALAERIESYRSKKRSLSFFEQCARISDMRKQDEYAWLKEVPAVSLNYAILNLDNAYKRFYNNRCEFPKYKSKKKCRNSVKFNIKTTGYDFNTFKVRIPKLGWVNICHERSFDPTVKINSTTVSRDACGIFWCTVSIDDGLPLAPKNKVIKERAVGIDVGIKDFAILSDGTKIDNRRFMESEKERIEKAQRGLSRKQRGNMTKPASNRYIRYKTKLARIYSSIENRRTNFLQQLSTRIIRNFNTVCVEDLNIKGMMKNKGLSGSIGSVSWSRFITMLEYKSEWYGVNFLRVGRFDPTSQTCSKCGYRNSDVKNLSLREWTCPQCGAHHDRDVNAAVNIMNAAIENYFNKQSPEVTGITDADGADSESNAGTCFRECNYASDETSTHNLDL